MDQPLRVGGGQPRGHLAPEIDRGPGRQRPRIAQQLRQRPPLDVLHDDPVAVPLHEIEHLDHVGVAELGRGPGLAAEAFPPRAPLLLVRPYPLGRHRPLQPVVPGQEHLSHPPGPQVADQAIGPDALVQLGHFRLDSTPLAPHL